jgi:hypothetical protein
VKLPTDTIVAKSKLDEYLLLHRDEDDKSGFLALAGYTLGNVHRLLNDLRIQLLPLDAELFDQTDYGPKYRIRGMLIGPKWACFACCIGLDERRCDRTDKVCYLVSGQTMKYPLYSRVALADDLPKRRLRRGDVAVVVEYHPGRPNQEPGYSLEIFNALGETVDVVTVRESQIKPLAGDELLSARPLAGTTG